MDSDYLFYAALIFAVLYWLFSTTSKEKIKDIKDTTNTIRGIADDIDKAIDKVENSNRTNKKGKAKD